MDSRDPTYWIDASAPRPNTMPTLDSPIGTSSREAMATQQIVLLVMLVLFLIDTFLPWQRACVNVSGLGLHISGCLSANAWSGTAAHVGQAAGVLAILAIVAVGLRLGGVEFGDATDLAARGGVYGTAAAGGLKWILVIGQLASFGAWMGLLLLLAMAILESVHWLGVR
jgi:hypothetical protein